MIIDISYIIPCYNCENTILEALKSIELQLNQPSYEIILINDGSCDNTINVLLNYKKDNPNKNITILNQDNNGPGSARNTGLKVAVGKYVVFVDSDDILHRDYIEKLFNAVIGYDFCFGDYNKILVNKNNKKVSMKSKCVNTNSNELIVNLLNGRCFVSLWNSIFLRRIIKDNNISFKENCYYGEDVSFIINYLFYCNSVNHINVPIYTYRYDNLKTKKRENQALLNDIKESILWPLYLIAKKQNNEEVANAFEFCKFPLMAATNLLLIGKQSSSYQEFKEHLSNADNLTFYLKNGSIKYLKMDHYVKLLLIETLIIGCPFLFYKFTKEIYEHE